MMLTRYQWVKVFIDENIIEAQDMCSWPKHFHHICFHQKIMTEWSFAFVISLKYLLLTCYLYTENLDCKQSNKLMNLKTEKIKSRI